jgi:hypothetical protein
LYFIFCCVLIKIYLGGDHVVHASGNSGGGGEAVREFESDARDVPWRTAAAKGRGWEVIGVDGNN